MLVVQEILGEGMFNLEKKEGMLLEEHSFIFGIVLPDNRDRTMISMSFLRLCLLMTGMVHSKNR